MANERKTENIVRDKLRELKYYKNTNILIEEQKSDNPRIQKLLKSASKAGGGQGFPEFIISYNKEDIIVVIECKAKIRNHQSESKDKYKQYAVDGVLNYASYLAQEYNVIAIGVSGEDKKNLLVSNYLWLKDGNSYKALSDNKILHFDDYKRIIKFDPQTKQKKQTELLSFAQELHDYIRDYAKLSEPQKPILISAILIALEDNTFRMGYKGENDPKELAQFLIRALERVLRKSEMPMKKISDMLQPYSFIKVHPELTRGKVLKNMIRKVEKNVRPFMNNYYNFDIIGQFYGEFLRYTGGVDKKALGIVLTPHHITELFAEMSELTTDSKVLDPCAGTGGFLISAMSNMIDKAGNDEKKIENIKQNQLIGVEQQPKMFALCASNMILRGDGKANLYFGSCFDFKEELMNRKPNVGLMNPPYSQKGKGLSELDFVYNLLECLTPNSTAIVIVPITCGLKPNPLRKKILEEHTLEAVMSMPEQLFYPVNVITATMVFKAKIPHNPNRKTWFGYWRDDGFEIVKNKGRLDKYNKWAEIKEKWLSAYFNKTEIPGFSVSKKVTAEDEWCAEAYLETDYSNLTKQDFENKIQEYLAFKIKDGGL